MKVHNKKTNGWDDWRITGQEKYLKGVKLKWSSWNIHKSSQDHDHCAFCWRKFCLHTECNDAFRAGYTTKDERIWICKECFIDFKQLFRWNFDMITHK